MQLLKAGCVADMQPFAKLLWKSVSNCKSDKLAYVYIIITTILLVHPFNGLFSRITWLSQYQKGKTSLHINEARWRGLGMQWHQLDHMQTICT